MPQTTIGFLSFAGGHLRWKFASIRILRQTKSSTCFESIQMYTEKKLDSIITPEIAQFIAANRKGYGLWIWKPIIVLDFLKKNPHCESILYLDAGCDFNYSRASRMRWEEYLYYLENFKAIIFQTPHLEKSYTTKRLVNRLRSDSTHLETGQIQAGTFFMTRDFALKFCEEWLAIMSEENFKWLKNLAEDRATCYFDNFIDYRYDQSIFSLLMKQQQVKTLQADQETDFSSSWKTGLRFPILTSRNRSIVPILKAGLVHRGLRRVERRVIRTYNTYNEYLLRRKSKK